MKKGLILLSVVTLTTALTSCIKINVVAPTTSETTESKTMTKDEALEMVESIDKIVSDTFNANSYREVTSASDIEVESYAKKIKEAILNDDLETISKNIYYPINFDEGMKDFSLRQTKKEVLNAEEFMEVVKDLKISEACKEVFRIETCDNLWPDVASGGISLGSGFIYFRDVNFNGVTMETTGNPEFKIISFAGLE